MKRNESNIKALKKAQACFEFFASLNFDKDTKKRFVIASQMAQVAKATLEEMQEKNQTF